MAQYVIISGCSGGGKSTLVNLLRQRGEQVVSEPGRRIVEQELADEGRALPWVDGIAFARRAIEVALADLETVRGWNGDRIFFDRGLIDAAAALQHLTGEPAIERLGRRYPFHPTVFLAPPWPEIFAGDAGRKHGFSDAVAEYDRLTRAYAQLGYQVFILPKVGVEKRADLLLAVLAPS